MKYLYALTADEATFMITQQVADTIYTDNIVRLSKTVNDWQVKRPNALVSEGTSNLDAFRNSLQQAIQGLYVLHFRLQVTTITISSLVGLELAKK